MIRLEILSFALSGLIIDFIFVQQRNFEIFANVPCRVLFRFVDLLELSTTNFTFLQQRKAWKSNVYECINFREVCNKEFKKHIFMKIDVCPEYIPVVWKCRRSALEQCEFCERCDAVLFRLI